MNVEFKVTYENTQAIIEVFLPLTGNCLNDKLIDNSSYVFGESLKSFWGVLHDDIFRTWFLNVYSSSHEEQKELVKFEINKALRTLRQVYKQNTQPKIEHYTFSLDS